MIISKHVDQNFIGDFQLLNKLNCLFLLFLISNAFSQSSDYEEYLRFLPESVRSSVESRLSSDVEDSSEYSDLNNSREEMFQKKDEDKELIIEYDEFGNEIPSFFGYDLFKDQNSFQPVGILSLIHI